MIAVLLTLALLPAAGVRVYHPVVLPKVEASQWTHIETCGRVTLVKTEDDGDLHIRLDAGGAFLVAEIVPYHTLPRPKVGQTIRVQGISRLDKTHHWYELHPLEAWVAVPSCGTSPDRSPPGS